MHRIKKLSGLHFMLPHFRNMERYLKCFFGFCSDCFIHHDNRKVKQGVHPSSWPWQLEKHPPQTTKAGQRKADSDGRWAASLQKNSTTRPETTHKCDFCDRNCHSQIDLFSDRRCCSNWADSLEVSAHGRPWPIGASQGRDCKTPPTSFPNATFLFLSLL